MKKIAFPCALLLIAFFTQLSGCTHVGMDLYGRLKPAPSVEKVKQQFASYLNISPDKVIISNIKGKEGNGLEITGTAAKDYTFDATINGKLKNCSFTQLINNDIYFTGCTVKNSAITTW